MAILLHKIILPGRLWAFIALGVSLSLGITGSLLLFFYTTESPALAFMSVARLQKDSGWKFCLLRLHQSGTSLLFLFLYLHLMRGLKEGLYIQKKRWIWGVSLFLATIIVAATGQTLSCSQHGWWSRTVLVHMVAALPGCKGLIFYLMGRLGWFFILHLVCGFGIFALAFWHISPHRIKRWRLNPPLSLSDLWVGLNMIMVWIVYCWVMPTTWPACHTTPANPMITPTTLSPAWYLCPWYTILCLVPHKGAGLLCIIGTVSVLFLVPWLAPHPIKNKPLAHAGLFFLGVAWSLLSVLKPILQPTPTIFLIGRSALAYHFFYFLIFLPSLHLFPLKNRQNKSRT